MLTNTNKVFIYYRTLLAIFFVFMAVCFFASAIDYYDTDLWYHLNGGKYYAENGTLPTTSFFSFLEPSRERVDYFWLFRASVYQLFQSGDYYALIALRGFFFLAAVAMLILMFAANKSEISSWTVIGTLVIASCLVGRFLNLRPHIFTYVFTIATLLIWEKYPRFALALPIISLVWVNCHGITYPVLLLIHFAYALQHLQKKDYSKFTIATVSVSTVLMTPHFYYLLPLPFINVSDAAAYIVELAPLTTLQLVSYEGSFLHLSKQALFNLYLLGVSVYFFWSLYQRQLSLTLIVLYIGSVVLLIRGVRFYYEFLILNLPLVRHFFINHKPQQVGRVSLIFTTWVFVVMCYSNFQSIGFPDDYPMNEESFPMGVVEFLNKVDASGKVFHVPNYGGFFQWVLPKKYQITMDMQVPHLFHDEDFFFVNQSFHKQAVFASFAKKYAPEFIIVARKNEGFAKIITEFPNYTPVFFDRLEIVYVDRQKYPQIAQKYSLQEINPYLHDRWQISDIPRDKLSLATHELERNLSIFPRNYQAQHMLSILYDRQKQWQKSAQVGEYLTSVYPQESAGYRIVGNILAKSGKLDEAITYYEKALAYAKKDKKSEIYVKIGGCYFQKKQYTQAYSQFEKGLPLFGKASLKVSSREIYLFALTAEKLNKNSKAIQLFQFALWKTPLQQKKFRQQLKKRLQVLKIK